MLLRRLAEDFRRQDWVTVTIELVLVIAGVLIALQVDNWHESRKDRHDEKIFLRELHDDILRANGQTTRTRALRLRQAEYLNSALELVFHPEPDRELLERECDAVAYSFATYVGRSDLPSLIQLQNTGRSGIISDHQLSSALAGLAQRRSALETVVREVRGVEIVSKYPDLFILQTKMVPVTGSPGESERDVDIQCDLAEMRANQALLNDLANNADAYDAFMRDGLLPWAAQNDVVHDRIDELLDISHAEENPT